ncbi:hypothetical protein JHD48_07390 [Sulfurimonas sp. SAG-AH-194-I05]|nr:hypothetical protein [Sulfurimonas sp. SAG-AH-194-I05]MDF1875554.1 hypothetical protein [Sulfurimonas sp. SAG-AH-194-I05]
MLQAHKSLRTPSQGIQAVQNELYSYQEKEVKIITIFNDSKGTTALIEDSQGEILQVPKDALRKIIFI